jgi:hypothetical protein
VKPGDTVQYSIVPVVGPDHNHLTLATAQASNLTDPMTVSPETTPRVSAYFNKGIVAAQWISRALAKLGKNAKMDTSISTPGNPLRDALSGLLRPQILSLLADAKNNNGEIYAALYELNDPELIPALLALGQRCHLILANGAFKSGKPDENADVRAQLRGKVDLHDRIVTSNHFAHNKFLVFCDSTGTPQSVLSGSTNWTKTGLCTQANNGIIVNDPELAAYFLEEWKHLKDAANGYPPTLAQANSTPKSVTVDGATITQWFAPTTAGQDLDFARKLISAAQRGILFLFFNPGQFVEADKPERWTLLQNILNRHQQGAADYNPGLYIRGVVNQEIANLTTESTTGPRQPVLDPTAPANPVTLFSGGDRPPQRLRYDAMVPKNIKDTFPQLDDGGAGQRRPRPQQGDRARSVRRAPGGDDGIAQSRLQGIDRERRQPHDRRRQRTACRRLCRQHHRDLPDLPVERLCRGPSPGPAGLARPGRQRLLAKRLS